MFKDYTMNQVILPLDLERKLQENDIAFVVNDLVETIPEEAFACFFRERVTRRYKHTVKQRDSSGRRDDPLFLI